MFFRTGTPACDIIIPAFNRPDLLRDLLLSLARHTNRSLLGHIWIGDDGSDRFTAGIFDHLSKESGLPITVIRHPTNLGFGGNCNALLGRTKASQCVLLNTDAKVPPFWLERMVEALAQNNVALATPFATDCANHTLRLREGQSWIDADKLLASRPPLFPDDCTAIGFCMGMRLDRLRKAGVTFFDPAFGRGYGEDTDLHYRVLQAALRSVIVDNLLVHHIGGSTFATVPGGPSMKQQGVERFLQKWGDVHAAAHTEFLRQVPLARTIDSGTGECRLVSPPSRIDVLFVIPNTHLRYGGVWFICKMIESLNVQGMRAAAYVINPTDIIADTQPFGFRAFESVDAIRASATGIGCVVSTSDRTVRPALSLSQEFSCCEVLLLQNMEVAFRTGISVDTFQQYKRIPNAVTVSEALKEYIELIHPGVNVTALPIGPDPYTFYPRDVQRIPRSVAIAVNDIPEKGFTRALELALLLRERGFSLTFFGWDVERYPIPDDMGTVMTSLDRDSLATLFSKTEFILDQSFVEGLGLLPLEAAFCGCIPILSARGAAEYLFEDGVNCIRIPGYRNLGNLLNGIAALMPDRIAELRENTLKLRSQLGLPQGLAAAHQAFARLSGYAEAAPATLSAYAMIPKTDH